MTRALIVVAFALAFAGAGAGLQDRRGEPFRSRTPPHATAGTRCNACHVTESWTKVAFNHDRTGFPLKGQHAQVRCSDCHAASDFQAALPTFCAACHRDVHSGEFGTRCASCHDEQSWHSRFNADAHRRTSFPLTGRHASIPCETCHINQRDRSFTRATVDCIACHQADYARTRGTSIDHVAAGFTTNCRDCHDPWTFRGGRFAPHSACFQLVPGPHAGISCLECHTALRRAVVTGACATNTAACTQCHTHACAAMLPRHRQVAGFDCRDRKCYECHRFAPLP
ncbi:MAG: cytochrome C [Myxococcales bacterium]